MGISQVWRTLSEGQGTVIASVITVIAAISGVVLGWWLFSGRVKNLEAAVQATERRVDEHLKSVEGKVTEYASTIKAQLAESLDEPLSALSQQLAQLSGSFADAPTSAPDSTAPVQQTAKDSMRENWVRIRDRLEAIASNPEIDGRTRAKYVRIDRRRYGDLVIALDGDGKLGINAASFREAVELWQKFRSGRSTPSSQEVKRIKELADSLTA